MIFEEDLRVKEFVQKMSSFQKQLEQRSWDDPKKMLGVVKEPQEATLGQSVKRGQTAVSSH